MNARPKGFFHYSCAVLFFLLLFLSPIYATTYYVDNTGGSNGNDGESTGQAWETIAYANTQLSAGDTLYIVAGTYSTNDSNAVINPDNDGTSGNPITYTNYSTDTVYIRGQRYGALISRDYITIDGLRIEEASQGTATMECGVSLDTNSDHIIVKNCTISKTDETIGSVGDLMGIRVGQASTYCEFSDNTISYIGGGSTGDGIKFQSTSGVCNAQYNLVDGNTFSEISHDPISVRGKYNVIKGNTITNARHRGLEIISDDSSASQEYNVIEDNIIHICGDSGESVWYNEGIACWGRNCILRRNRIYSNLGVGIKLIGKSTRHCKDNRVYHNVFYDNGTQQSGTWNVGLLFDEQGSSGTMDGNIVKNNINYNNDGTGVTYIRYAVSGDVTYSDNYWDADGDPLFTDAPNGDFTIPSNSPCVGAAGWLTTITSANGTDTSFVVADASYFCDGHNITTGDEIQLEGKTAAIGITAINYGTNTITVDESVTWVQGDGVGLEFEGSNPDIGWYEYVPLGGGADQVDWPNIYIDADAGAGGVGSQADPYDEFSDINWTTGGDNSVFDYYDGSPATSVTINFQDDDEWREEINIGCSGTAAYPLIVQSYGSGADPIINGSDLVATWTAADVTETEDLDSDEDFTKVELDAYWRNILPIDTFANDGLRVRVYIVGHTGTATIITGCSIGEATTNDHYTESPTRITFDTGNNGKTITAGTGAWSDWVTYSFDASARHLVHVNLDDTGGTVYLHRTDAAHLDGSYYKYSNGDKTMDQDPDEMGTSTRIYSLDQVQIERNGDNVWTATLATEPDGVFVDDTRGTEVATLDIVNSSNEWYWESNNLYLYATADPDNLNSPGVEATARVCIDFNNQDYITIRNLHLTKGKTANIYLDNGSSDSIIDTCTVDYAGLNGIGCNDTDGPNIDSITIQDCTIAYCGYNGIAAFKSAYNWTITGNTVNNNCVHPDASGEGGIKVGGGATRISGGHLIENNTVYSNGAVGIWLDYADASGGSDKCVVRYNESYSNTLSGIEVECTDHQEVYYNLSYSNTGSGIYVAGDDSSDPADDNLIYNNVCYGNTEHGIYVRGRVGAGAVNDNIFKNNISIGNTIRELKCTGGGENDGTDGTGNVYTHNCLDAEAADFVEWGAATPDTYDIWETAYGATTSSVESDPLMTDPGSDDFTLQVGSPCMNKGTHVGLFLDHLELPVPIGHRPDIGAYEHKGGGSIF